MSRRLIGLNSDLSQLRREGYDVDIQSTFLLVRDVPYVGAGAQIKRGVLVSTLVTSGDKTASPIEDHTMMFIGEFPHDSSGSSLEALRHAGGRQLASGLAIDFSFSQKKWGGIKYDNYYEKVTAYVAMLESHAQAIDPQVTARTFPVIVPDEEEDSVFEYMETASGRAGIVIATEKLRMDSVAIVGLGGSGSYLLDLIAKTPVREVHLYDGDTFLTHNAFRAPGAPSLDELRAKRSKVAYFAAQYSKMHKGIVQHPYFIDASNAGELLDSQFVFLCVDAGDAKRIIVEKLEETQIPFIDAGMGLNLRSDNSLGGILRVTISEPDRRAEFRKYVSLADAGPEAEYDDNIQVADANALNAALAMIRWKKYLGFYGDFIGSVDTSFVIDCNSLIDEDNR